MSQVKYYPFFEVIEISKFYFFLIFSLLILFFLGKVILETFCAKKTNSFHSIFTGIFISVFFTSIYFTKCVTVNIVFVPVIIMLVFINKVSLKNPFPSFNYLDIICDIKRILIISFAVYALAVIEFFSFSEFPFNTLHFDFHAYAQFSRFITEIGNENTFAHSNYFDTDLFKNKTSPYHYYELWLNGFLAKLLKVSYLKALMLLTYPIFQITSLLGFYHLLKQMIKKKYQIIILLFSTALITPLYFSFYDQFELLKYYQGTTFNSIFFFGKKYGSIVIFSLLSLDFLFKKKYSNFIIIISSLPILSIGTIGGILVGISVFIILCKIFKLSNPKIKLIWISPVISFLILIFYKIFSFEATENIIRNESLLTKILLDGFDIQTFKVFVFKTIFPLIRIILFSLPYISLIIFFNEKYKHKKIFLLIISVVTASLLTSSFAWGLPESGQLVYNCLPIFNVFIIFLLFETFKETQFKKTYILILACICTYNLTTNLSHSQFMHDKYLQYEDNMSDRFKQAIFQKSKDNKYIKIAYVNKEDSTDVIQERYKNPLIFSDYFDSNIIVTNVNNPKKIADDNSMNRFNFLWPIYNFEKKHQKLTYNELLKKFLIENEIKYLMTDFESKDLEKLLNLKFEESDKLSDFKLWSIQIK